MEQELQGREYECVRGRSQREEQLVVGAHGSLKRPKHPGLELKGTLDFLLLSCRTAPALARAAVHARPAASRSGLLGSWWTPGSSPVVRGGL